MPPSRKRLRYMSKKRRRVMGARRRAVQARMELCGAVCEAIGRGVACSGQLQPHEPLTRARGGSITDVDNIRMLCSAHHDWVHAYPLLAERAGLLVASWDR